MFPSPPRSTLFPYTTLFRSLDGEVRQIASERSELVKESDRLRQSLREAALVDYRRVDFHGEKVLPAELGRRIANEREQHAWIPGPASESETCPVRDEDVKKLHRINAQLTDEDKALLAGPMPTLDPLPTPQDLIPFVDQLQSVAGKVPATSTD